MIVKTQLLTAIPFRHIILGVFLSLSCHSITASATLLGRLNVFYNTQLAQAKNESTLLGLHAQFVKQEKVFVDQIKTNADAKKEILTEVDKNKQAKTSKEDQAKNGEGQLTSDQIAQLKNEIKDLDDKIEKQNGEINKLDDANKIPEAKKNQLSEIITALTKVITALDLKKKVEIEEINIAAKIDAETKKEKSEKIKFDNEKTEKNKKALNDASEALSNTRDAESKLRQTKLDVEDNVTKSHNELDRLLANISVINETINGVPEGVGSTSFITSNTVSSIAINAYRYNILLGVRDNDCHEIISDCITQTAQYRSFPVYIFLKKTNTSKIDKKTLANDLIDNEHGGTVNLKFSGAWDRLFGVKPKMFDFSHAPDPELRQYGAKLVFDFGIKLVEAPALQAAGAPATTDPAWIGAGYVGVGLNFEFPIFAPTGTRTDLKQYIKPGSKPAGGMALGLGAYKNYVGSGQFDNTLFSTQVPNVFSTWAIMYEIQITDLLSVKGTRMAPTKTSDNPLGTYTSFAVGYKF